MTNIEPDQDGPDESDVEETDAFGLKAKHAQVGVLATKYVENGWSSKHLAIGVAGSMVGLISLYAARRRETVPHDQDYYILEL